MRKFNPYLLVVLLSFIGFACKEDKLESLTIKSSGNLSITLMHDDKPLANHKVWFGSAWSGSEDVMLTDENGLIDFGPLNEGPYELYTTILDPYTEVEQEIQVISGENIHREIQVKNYVGTYKLSIRDYNDNELVKEDLGFKAVFVPLNDAYNEVYNYDDVRNHISELATKEVDFGNKGFVEVELPVAEYNVYVVNGTNIIRTYNYVYIEKLEDYNQGVFWIYADDYRE